MNFKDQNLTEGIRLGDGKAFERLFRKYRKKLIRFAYSYVHSIAVAEDIVQESFLKIWQLRKSLDPQDSIRAYLYQAVRNNALDYNKHKSVEEKNLPDVKRTHQSTAEKGEETIADSEFVEAVQQEIEKLPDRAKEVYKLSRTNGLTYKEIAEVMDISVKTV